MRNPLISAIVPAYNEENYLSYCLRSLINQDFPKKDYEIIVIDNNSTDKTASIAKKFGARVVKEENQGLTYARIRGIKEAKGEIIAFVDADTTVNKDWLKQILSLYQKNPKIVGLGFMADFTPKNFWTFVSQPIEEIAIKLFKIMPGYCFSFKKSAYLKSGGYLPSIKFSEDVFISKRLKRVGQVMALKNHQILTSSRRFHSLRNFFPYVSKIIISFLTVLFINHSFFQLGVVRQKEPKL